MDGIVEDPRIENIVAVSFPTEILGHHSELLTESIASPEISQLSDCIYIPILFSQLCHK